MTSIAPPACWRANYHHYAAYLAANRFAVVTYDYRGIGLSRPADLPG